MFDISLFSWSEVFEKLSDEQICIEIKNWNHKLFDILYRRRKDNIYSYIWNILNYNTQDALNVTSDVFVKVFNYSKSNDIQKFKSFLYRTAHNEAVNYIASFKSENSLWSTEDTFDYMEDSWALSYKNDVNSAYKKQLFIKSFKKLDSKYWEALYLYYYENKDYDEIADILGTNKNTVWTLIKRWKERLQLIIEKDWYKDIFIE